MAEFTFHPTLPNESAYASKRAIVRSVLNVDLMIPRYRTQVVRVLRHAVLLVAGFLSVQPAVAQDLDAREIIRLAFEHDERNEILTRNYTFQQRIEERALNKKGEIKSTKSRTHDVTLLDGTEYRRLIAKDDEPLSSAEEQKEQRKLDKSIEKVQNETPKQRAKRFAKRDEHKQEQRKWIAEIQNSFDFQLKGEETVDGVETYVIDASPKTDYKADFDRARFLTKMRGRFWIAKADYAWMRLEAETLDTISFGWFLFRLGPGSIIEFSQTEVNDEVWLIEAFRVRLHGRVALLKGLHREIVGTYSEYRKFSADSNVTFSDAVE